MLRTLLGLALAANLCAARAPAGAGAWEDVELPRGFGLDLASGVVSNRWPADAPVLRYEEGLLRSAPPLRLLEPLGRPGTRSAVERGSGRPVEELAPGVGAELLFDLGEPGFGYLRVLHVAADRLWLEHTFEPAPGAARLVREPAELRALSLERAVLLDWPAAEGRFRVERRALGAQGSGSAWELLVEIEGHTFEDAGASSRELQEYRVRRSGSGAPLGARVRALAGMLPEEQPIELTRGRGLNLLAGVADGQRIDLAVEYVGSNGAQLFAGNGVQMRMLNANEMGSWELPSADDGSFREQRVFLTSDRALALRLPEGVYCRVRVESLEGGTSFLHRQIDLEGGRLFAPAPSAPLARWEAGRGAVLSLPRGGAPGRAWVGFLLEREDGFQSGRWSVVAELGRAEGEYAERVEQAAGLVRFRLRHLLEDGRRSLPGPAVSVLVGDDGGAGTEALLRGALAELAAPDFERRLAAEGVLQTLGTRAWPALRELLASEVPEEVAAARRILGRFDAERPLGEEGEAALPPELAPSILLARARAKGLGEPPEGWLDPERDRRALALLRTRGGPPRPGGESEEAGLDAWRELMAEADPDPGVRLVATAVRAWRAASPPAWEEGPRAAAGSAAGRDSRSDPLRPQSGEELGALLEAAARSPNAWPSLVARQLLEDLRRSQEQGFGGLAESAEAGALERALLGLALIQRHQIADPGEVFVSAALAVVEDPAARLRALVDLAKARLARASGPAGGSAEEPRQRLELAAPDGELLAGELEGLRERAESQLDLVLPAGVYTLPEGRQNVMVGGTGLRILGEGRPVLRFGLSFYQGADVVLEGLHLAPTAGNAIVVDRSAVLLRDTLVEAPVLAAQVNDGVLELDRCEVLPRSEAGQMGGGIRAARLSLVVARESRLVAGNGVLFGARTTFLERCVVDGGERNALEARIDGELVLVDTLVRSRADALANVPAGVLEGPILVAGGQAARNLGAALWVCPEHALHVGDAGALFEARRCRRCPLGR